MGTNDEQRNHNQIKQEPYNAMMTIQTGNQDPNIKTERYGNQNTPERSYALETNCGNISRNISDRIYRGNISGNISGNPDPEIFRELFLEIFRVGVFLPRDFLI